MGKRSTLPTIVGPHHADHEPGGLDEVVDIDILNTGVLLSAHHTRHEPGGADVVTGVAPGAHEATHRAGGSDPLNHDNLAGYVAAEHLSLPNTIASVLTDHDLARHPLSIIPTMDDAHIPNLETLSYGGAFAVAQIPTLSIAKISDIPGSIASILTDHTKAVHDALGLSHDSLSDVSTSDHHVKTGDNEVYGLILCDLIANRPAAGIDKRFFWATDEHILYRDTGAAWEKAAVADHPDLDGIGASDHHTKTTSLADITDHNLANHPLAIIPTMDDAHIPDVETLSYTNPFATGQIPSLDASKITTGVFSTARIPNLDAAKITTGTFDLARIPTMDDGHIPDIETLSYTNPFAAAQIPNLDASKITTGTFGVARGGTGLSTIASGGILYASALDVLSRLAPTAANQVLRSTAANALQFAALVAADIPNLDASKITTGTFADGRIAQSNVTQHQAAIDHDALLNFVAAEHLSLPNTIANVLTDHTKAVHDALGIAPAAHHTTHESGGTDEIKDMELNPAPGADNTGSGILTVGTVGETVAAGEVLYMASTGKYMKAKGDAVGTMPAVVLAMESISADATGKLLHMGYYRHDAWNWATIGGLLYVSEATAGALTQTRPSTTGNQVQICGYAVTADVVYFAPGLEIVEIS